MTPLRPIDALFVHPKQRCYVIYNRGTLWQLPRMKIDNASWQRRTPYVGDTHILHLSRNQILNDPILSQQLRTLNLPAAVRGITLPQFEVWWETHGFEWTKKTLLAGQSPLAAHQMAQPKSVSRVEQDHAQTDDHVQDITDKVTNTTKSNAIRQTNMATSAATPRADTAEHHLTKNSVTDIFADMLDDLTQEMLNLKQY